VKKDKSKNNYVSELLTVGPKFTRLACRVAAAAAIDRYLPLRARARPQQQTRRPPPLLSIDGTDRRTDYT